MHLATFVIGENLPAPFFSPFFPLFLFFIEIIVHLMYNYIKVFLLRNGGLSRNDVGIKGYNR